MRLLPAGRKSSLSFVGHGCLISLEDGAGRRRGDDEDDDATTATNAASLLCL